MTRVGFIAVVGALVVAAARAAAEPSAPASLGGFPRSELAVELGGVKSFLQRTRRVGDGESGANEIEPGLAEAASWLFRFNQTWWFGPRLGAEQYFNIHDADNSHTAHAGGMLVARPGEISDIHPRVSFGLAVAWEHLSRPQSFEIEQQMDSAFGAMWTAGLGIERAEHTLRWSVDLSLGQCSFTHEHEMLDTRTNDRVSQRIYVSRENVLLQFGVGWFPGG